MTAEATTESTSALTQALRDLHRDAGYPSTRWVSYKTQHSVSHTTVANLLEGTTLPRWSSVEYVVTALGGKPDDFRGAWEEEQENRPAKPVEKATLRKGTIVYPGDTVVLTADPGSEDLSERVEDLQRLMPPHVTVVLIVGATATVIRAGQEMAA